MCNSLLAEQRSVKLLTIKTHSLSATTKLVSKDAKMKALTVVESPKGPQEIGSFDPLPRAAVFFLVFKRLRRPY